MSETELRTYCQYLAWKTKHEFPNMVFQIDYLAGCFCEAITNATIPKTISKTQIRDSEDDYLPF